MANLVQPNPSTPSTPDQTAAQPTPPVPETQAPNATEPQPAASTGPTANNWLSTLRTTVNTWPPQLVGSVGLAIIILLVSIGWRFLLTAETRQSIISLDLPNPFSSQQTSPQPTTTPSPTPRPIAKGEQSYNIRSSNETGPIISRATVSEFDPIFNQEQKIQLQIRSRTKIPAEEVTAELITDNETQTFSLKKANTNAGIEYWEGAWTTTDTHDFIYSLNITASNSEGVGKVELSFR